MREERLLERIARWEDGGQRTHLAQAELLAQSVTAHVARILNTRKGSVPIDETMGIPDFANVAGSFADGSARDIETDMEQVVSRFEPRLANPQIRLVADGKEALSLRFLLTGSVRADDREIPLRLNVTVSADGRVSVEP